MTEVDTANLTYEYERRGSLKQRLSFKVTEAVRNAKNLNRQDLPSLAQLRLAYLPLHGREDDLKLLKSKLRELGKRKEGGGISQHELLLITGMSGMGKSALVMRGLRDPAQKMGIAFVRGKFDQNNTALPFSAIVDALSSLTKYVMA